MNSPKIYKILLKFIIFNDFLKTFRTVPLLIRGLATRASQIVKPTMLSSLYISIYFKTIYWQHLLLLTSQNFAKNITVWNVTLNFYGYQLCHFSYSKFHSDVFFFLKIRVFFSKPRAACGESVQNTRNKLMLLKIFRSILHSKIVIFLK